MSQYFSNGSKVLLTVCFAGLLAGCTGTPPSDGQNDNNMNANDNVADEIPDPSTFRLKFAAAYQGTPIGCGDQITGMGPEGTVEVELNDLRFYVSNIKFYGEDGQELAMELDENDFQYSSDAGSVALVDLTGTDAGACAGEGLSFPEGTARTNDGVTGTTIVENVHAVSFDVAIPQSLMKEVLNSHTAEDAPSPLREMHWSWAFAYRFFVMNFTMTAGDTPGEGYVHVGSTDCGGDGVRALTDRDECGHPNTPSVMIEGFSLNNDTVMVDIEAILAGLDFQVDAFNDVEEPVVVPGVACHSSVEQPDCINVFGNFGIIISNGQSAPELDTVFSKMP